MLEIAPSRKRYTISLAVYIYVSYIGPTHDHTICHWEALLIIVTRKYTVILSNDRTVYF